MSSVNTIGELNPICSADFTGEALVASTGSFDALDRSRDSSGEDGVDDVGSADRDIPGVIAADTNDWLLSSCNAHQ